MAIVFHFSFQSGLRFSKNAEMISFSSVEHSRAMAAFMYLMKFTISRPIEPAVNTAELWV
jgi:hypothetical protein